jgi:hypothetical protein
MSHSGAQRVMRREDTKLGKKEDNHYKQCGRFSQGKLRDLEARLGKHWHSS